MFLKDTNITDNSLVTDIVVQDYRTSSVFRKHGIDYCCGGRLPLQKACEIRGVDPELIKKELADSLRNIQISNSIDFKNWSVDFLIDYLLNVHHSYLVNNFPDVIDTVERFVRAHSSKYPFLPELSETVFRLRDKVLPHLEQEEKIIFPYIKQVAHAYNSREPYAALLVRTLRKPVESLMNSDHEQIAKDLQHLRKLTNNYYPPNSACISHKVSLFKLKELDNDLVQHVHLEGNILFPRAIAMEKEMLSSH
jgi:regulator of cell morphogenesis and NO signaling